MGEIPAQLVARLPQEGIRTGCRVERLGDGEVRLASGERLGARALVIATEGAEAVRLLGREDASERMAGRGTTCVHYAAERAPCLGPYLLLNGEGRGRINSLLCPSNLSGHYAPPGRALVTVNCQGVPDDPERLETDLRRELTAWFGDQVRAWERLAIYRLPQALPVQAPPLLPAGWSSGLRRGFGSAANTPPLPPSSGRCTPVVGPGRGVADALLGRVSGVSAIGG